MTDELTPSKLPNHLVAPRILFYAVNGLGLGHVTRLLAIARAVRALAPEAQILFVTTSEADWVIHREGFAAVKLPSRSCITETGLQPGTYTKLVHTVVLNVVSSFSPAILVADTFPAGASQELLPCLSWDIRRAFIYRAQRHDRATSPFFQAALGHYHVVISPHEEGSETIPLPAGMRTVWTGQILIRTRDNALSREDARGFLGIPAEARAAYITFGGGGETEMARATEAAIEASVQSGWLPCVPDAPLSRKRLSLLGAHFVNHYPMAEMLPAFDAAVSAGGYNTVGELMHFGIPSVLIPFERSLDDQEARVSRLVSSGAALTSTVNIEEIASRLSTLDTTSVRDKLSASARATVPSSGADRAAEAILQLL